MSRKATKKNGIQGIVSVVMRIYFSVLINVLFNADIKNAICFSVFGIHIKFLSYKNNATSTR